MCEHKLVDVWGDGRAPIATEITQDEAKPLVEVDPVVRYMNCADPDCGLEIEE